MGSPKVSVRQGDLDTSRMRSRAAKADGTAGSSTNGKKPNKSKLNGMGSNQSVQATNTASPAEGLQGRIESIAEASIAGWAWNPQTPNEPVKIELLEEDERIAMTVADRLRPELALLGCGEGRCGFDIAFAKSSKLARRRVLTLRCVNSLVSVPGSPFVLESSDTEKNTAASLAASSNGTAPEFRAYIDKVKETEILGWIMAPDQPLDRFVVALKEGKRILARAAASQLRLDLAEAGIGDGCYSFTIEPPPMLADGKEHLLDVVEEESGFLINQEPIRWCRGEYSTRTYLQSRKTKSANESRLSHLQDSYHFCLYGPMKGDYSLAVVNRHFAAALIRMGHEAVIIPQEADLTDDPGFQGMPELSSRLIGQRQVGSKPIHSSNDWPFRDACAGEMSVVHCCAWEESILPFELAARLSDLSLVTTTASFVTRALQNSGVTCKLATIGNGVDHVRRPGMQRDLRAPDASKPFVFLHVSSCFPRKGVDVLLDAYFAEFSGVDNVRLVIKTFDNPHNRELLAHVARKRSEHETPPALDVRIKSLDDDAYYDLFVEADCLVAPSFGEGFLLPGAEALLNNVPVLTTNWGGHLDFCGDGAAWLIDADLEKSRSHVAGPGSLWAVPSVQHLRRLMREMTQVSVHERASRIMRGQRVLERDFRWTDVAGRYLDAIAAIASTERPTTGKVQLKRSDADNSGNLVSGQSAPSMVNGQSANGSIKASKSDSRHVVISTFAQRCGIATFVAELLDSAVSQFQVAGVVSEDLGEASLLNDGARPPFPVQRVWRRHSSSVLDTINATLRLYPDHVLIQHHPGIFGWDMLAAIVRGLHEKTRVTIELHSCDGRAGLVTAVSGLQFANRVITHNGPDYEITAKLFGTDRTSLIPHGICPPAFRRDSLRDPWAPEGVKLASFGMAGPHKGFHKVINTLALLRNAGLNARYHLFTSFDPSNNSARRYLKFCIEYARQLGVQDAFTIDFRFLSLDELIVRLSQCDVGVMVYDNDVAEGASGAVRVMLRANLPLVLNAAPIFEEFRNVAAIVDDKGLSLARRLYQLILSPKHQGWILEKQAQFATQTSWQNVAKMVFGCFDAY